MNFDMNKSLGKEPFEPQQQQQQQKDLSYHEPQFKSSLSLITLTDLKLTMLTQMISEQIKS
jgi:hypothetical protein